MSNFQGIIMYAGGGTGGHIYPGLAIHEQIRHRVPDLEGLFLVSQRPLDTQILKGVGWAYHPLRVQPMPRGVKGMARWPGFVAAWRGAVREVGRMMKHHRPAAVVALGGFVSGPVLVSARRAGVPVVLVNLDAVPGATNRWLARRSTRVFSAYPWSRAHERIGLPLRQAAFGPDQPEVARTELGLRADTPVLFVTGGSQGARTINDMALALVQDEQIRARLQDWQILHLTGSEAPADRFREVYQRVGVEARVEPFLERIGLAWSAANVAISRAGAGSVAEMWANATPTVFLPYPYHRDQHQKLNIQGLVKLGGAYVQEDLINPRRNVESIRDRLTALLTDHDLRSRMAGLLRQSYPGNGAQTVADWLIYRVGEVR